LFRALLTARLTQTFSGMAGAVENRRYCPGDNHTPCEKMELMMSNRCDGH